MSGPINWDKVNRERRLTYSPSPRTQSASQRQLAYIQDLKVRKGKPAVRLPKTKQRASEIIEELLILPDIHDARSILPPEPEPKIAEPDVSQELVVELRKQLPVLTPMQCHSLIQLFVSIDELGTALVLENILAEPPPKDADQVVTWLLRRFLEEFGLDN